jgi:hypothetical protein
VVVIVCQSYVLPTSLTASVTLRIDPQLVLFIIIRWNHIIDITWVDVCIYCKDWNIVSKLLQLRYHSRTVSTIKSAAEHAVISEIEPRFFSICTPSRSTWRRSFLEKSFHNDHLFFYYGLLLPIFLTTLRIDSRTMINILWAIFSLWWQGISASRCATISFACFLYCKESYVRCSNAFQCIFFASSNFAVVL